MLHLELGERNRTCKHLWRTEVSPIMGGGFSTHSLLLISFNSSESNVVTSNKERCCNCIMQTCPIQLCFFWEYIIIIIIWFPNVSNLLTLLSIHKWEETHSLNMFIKVGANLNTQEAYIISVLAIYGIHVENWLVLYFGEEPRVLVLKNQIRIVLVPAIKQTNYKCLGLQVPHTNGTRNWDIELFYKGLWFWFWKSDLCFQFCV